MHKTRSLSATLWYVDKVSSAGPSQTRGRSCRHLIGRSLGKENTLNLERSSNATETPVVEIAVSSNFVLFLTNWIGPTVLVLKGIGSGNESTASLDTSVVA